MLSCLQKPSLRDVLLMHAQTRICLYSDEEILDLCNRLSQLTAFEKAILTSWSIDSHVDLHYVSAINNN